MPKKKALTPVTVITGASAGLGVDFAHALSGRGERLVLVARRKDRLSALARELGNARAFALDLSAADAADRLMADLASNGETCATLINNAGFGHIGTIAKADPKVLRQMIDLNIGALTDLARAVLPAMIARGNGAILNVASTAAFQPGPGMAVYFATKAYVLSFTEALHEEVRHKGIRVTALCPGPTRTEFGDVAGFKNKIGKAFDKIAMESAPVVAAGLAALDRNKAIRVTGVLNKVGAAAPRFLPRAVIRKIAGALKF